MDYKEKLEEAKKLYKTANDDQKYALELLFPEIVENEDELKWLKQFIQEEAYSLSMDIRDNEDRLKLKKLQRSLEWLEKQDEQNKIEALRTEYEKGRADTIAEMESSCREEDKQMSNVIISDVLRTQQKCGIGTDEWNIREKALNWFKSIRLQNHWKPTKEQMYMLEWLTTNVLDDGVVGNKAKEVLNTLIEQLKSL